MSIDKAQFIKRVKRKSKSLYNKFIKDKDVAAVKYLISNNKKYEGILPQDCLKLEIPYGDFLHAVSRDRDFDSFQDICNSDNNCFVYDYLIEFEELNEKYQHNKRSSLANGKTQRGRDYVRLQDIISIYQGQGRHTSMISFRNGKHICAIGSPKYMVYYMCDKNIPEEELEPFDKSKMFSFIIDSELYNPSRFLDVYDSYKIESKKETESESDFKNRVYEQFEKFRYMWVKD